MKVFIWIFCFFVLAVIQTAARQAGVLLGAIPAMLLYGLAWWSAKKLCALWDEHKAAKAVDPPAPEELPHPQPESEPTVVEPPAEVPTFTEPPAPAQKAPKLRFCKLCGSPIDPTTRQCTGCGKQYFRPPVLQKKYLAIVGAALACVAVVLLIFGLASRLSAADAQIAELNSQIAKLEDTVAKQEHDVAIYKRDADSYRTKLTQKSEAFDTLREENAELCEENTTYREYLDYCEFYCAYVTCSGDKITSSIYHRLDCPYAKAAEYLRIFYIDFLESRGYTPCSHCYG